MKVTVNSFHYLENLSLHVFMFEQILMNAMIRKMSVLRIANVATCLAVICVNVTLDSVRHQITNAKVRLWSISLGLGYSCTRVQTLMNATKVTLNVTTMPHVPTPLAVTLATVRKVTPAMD